jgi:hypothetical protein
MAWISYNSTRLKISPNEMPSPAEQVPGRPHRCGRHVGLGEHASTEQHRNLMGVDRVVFGLAGVDGFHLQRVAQDTR